jgi:RimJ/RimL family protein N-acetyltransferase
MAGVLEISTDAARLDVAFIHRYLSTDSYWAKGRPREVVERSIAHSICFGAFLDDRQVGFARVATDRAVFAYIMDVFVVPEHRGAGIASQLMAAVLAHPDLQGLRLIALRTRDAHPLYARFGFTAVDNPESFMVRQWPSGPSTSAAGARVNELGQPIGFALQQWSPPPGPPREPMQGRYCRVVPIDERFAPDLFDAYSLDREGRNWTYLPYGPFQTVDEYRAWMRATCFGPDPFFYAILDRNERAIGVTAHMRIMPAAGSIEVGHVNFSPRLQRSRAATEAIYLMAQRAFALGYRRYEWKCDALNLPSRAAAPRFGFTVEGVFRQATVVKGRNRDTAWYAMLDSEWPAIQDIFERWLAPENFDNDGTQRSALSELMARRPR